MILTAPLKDNTVNVPTPKPDLVFGKQQPNRDQFFMPDFLEIQRRGFFYFLENGILHEFQKRNPITSTDNDVELTFYPEFYQFEMPACSLEETLFHQKSYVSKLWMPVQYTDRRRKTIQIKWMLLAHLPLMTNRGHFLLNGSPRIVVNQLIRSPGIYFRESQYEIHSDKAATKPEFTAQRYYADIICLKGTWLRIELDKESILWARLKQGPKVPFFWILLAFGLTDRLLFSLFTQYGRSANSALKFAYQLKKLEQQFLPAVTSNKTMTEDDVKFMTPISTPPDAWRQLSYALNLTTNSDPKLAAELGRKWIFKKFMNPRTYDLGLQGRFALNQKLNINIDPMQTTLTVQDLLAATDRLFQLQNGDAQTDDIDHLKNKRVRTAGELIQVQLNLGLLRLENNIRLKLSTSSSDQNFELESLVNSNAIDGAFKEFFGTNPLSQLMDQLNPLAELTHKRRLTSLGLGGVSRDTATLAVRGIHPSHYGRLCPIETPEGKNTGLVNSVTTYGRVSLQGLLESPFYKAYKGFVLKDEGLVYLTAEQEESIQAATPDLECSQLGFLPKQPIPTRSGPNFTLALRPLLKYAGVSPIQMISVATSLIPFLEHDDANRALMGSNMQRQAVPLIRPTRPLVGTGLEARVMSDSGHLMLSEKASYIMYVSGSIIEGYTMDQ